MCFVYISRHASILINYYCNYIQCNTLEDKKSRSRAYFTLPVLLYLVKPHHFKQHKKLSKFIKCLSDDQLTSKRKHSERAALRAWAEKVSNWSNIINWIYWAGWFYKAALWNFGRVLVISMCTTLSHCDHEWLYIICILFVFTKLTECWECFWREPAWCNL